MAFSSFTGAFAGGATVQIVIRALDDFSKTFDNAKDKMRGLEKFGKGATAALLAGGAAVAAAGGAMLKLAADAGKGEAIGRTFNQMFGEKAPDALANLREAVRGTVDDVGIMQQANQAMLLGINPDALPEMFKGAFAASQATGRPVSDAISDITTGIGRQSRMILDNLGIIVKQEEANKKLADSLGKNVNELTDAERKTAFMDATMEALALNAEKVGDIEDNVSIKTQQMGAQMENAKQKTGEMFGPSLEKMLTAAQPLFEKIGTIFIEKVVPALIMFIDAFADLLSYLGQSEVFNGFLDFLGYVLEGLGVLFALVSKGIETFIQFIDVIWQWIKVLAHDGIDYLMKKWEQFKLSLQIIKDYFSLVVIGFRLGWEYIKLGAVNMVNKVIEVVGGMINKVIGWINNLISAFNRVTGSRIGLIKALDVGAIKIDTAGIEANIAEFQGQGQTLAKQISVNIETLSGFSVDDVADALKKKLNDLVAT